MLNIGSLLELEARVSNKKTGGTLNHKSRLSTARKWLWLKKQKRYHNGSLASGNMETKTCDLPLRSFNFEPHPNVSTTQCVETHGHSSRHRAEHLLKFSRGKLELWMVAKSDSHQLETMGNHSLWYLQNHPSRVSEVVQDFVHPQYVQ